MLITWYVRFVVAAIVVNADTYWSPTLLPIVVLCSFLSLLSSVALLFFSCLVHRSQDELTCIKMWKKGRSQRILLRTCREIVYSVVLRWGKKKRKNIEYIVHTSDHFYLLHALVMYFVRIVIRRRELCLLNWNVKLRRVMVDMKWKREVSLKNLWIL